jgi:hypothetical protein
MAFTNLINGETIFITPARECIFGCVLNVPQSDLDIIYLGLLRLRTAIIKRKGKRNKSTVAATTCKQQVVINNLSPYTAKKSARKYNKFSCECSCEVTL